MVSGANRHLLHGDHIDKFERGHIVVRGIDSGRYRAKISSCHVFGCREA